MSDEAANDSQYSSARTALQMKDGGFTLARMDLNSKALVLIAKARLDEN